MLLAAGCGNSRTPAPDLSRPAVPHGTQQLAFPASGLSLRAPANWQVSYQQAPLVVTISSGHAVVAVWRYPRSERLPDTQPTLAAARLRLLDAVRARDPRVHLIRSSLGTVDGDHAIEVDAIEQIAGETRRVRSLHVFAISAELVLDEYAPPSVFHTVDHDVFSPLKRSLRVFGLSAS
jgi:hypothetical protein